jgi:DNA polymerase-1
LDTILCRLPYRQVWLVDFEFNAESGERPDPVCLVARELRSGRTIRLWRDEFGKLPPYPTDEHSLFVAYYASAEIGCHLVINWPVPVRILDLFTEFRNHTSPLHQEAGNGLLGALTYFGLDGIGTLEKEEMRTLILRGGPWSGEERKAILEYCESDVSAMCRLLPAMFNTIDFPRALLRGRMMAAIARIEHVGTPIDLPLLETLRARWDQIQDALIQAIDVNYGVFDGRTFKLDRFNAWLVSRNLPWPVLESGRLDLSDQAFRGMSQSHPEISPLRELRHALSDMRLNELKVGRDGFNRCLLSPFRSKTGRNQPSNTRFIFGPSVWLRGLIKPPAGHGVAYVDWEQQEFGIAASLSGDQNMLEAYQSGDPYLAFAKQAKAIPPGGTKDTHGPQRDLFKQCSLAVQYGMEERSLATRVNQPQIVARGLLRLHHEVYSRFWAWSDNIVDRAMLNGTISTVFGWKQRVLADANPRSLRNFPMQANGAEMLRLALCTATEAGLQICAPVHDAILVVAPVDRLESDVRQLQTLMEEASRIVLGGFPLRTEAKLVRYPDRYTDKRGAQMWNQVMQLLQ